MASTSSGVKYQISLLEQAGAEVSRMGELSEPMLKALIDGFGTADNSLAILCAVLNKKIRDSGSAHAKVARDNLVTAIAVNQQEIVERLGIQQQREALQLDSTIQSFSLPSQGALDRILRYEMAIERQLYRALDQLERLQRQRNGDKVPPPLRVQLGN